MSAEPDDRWLTPDETRSVLDVLWGSFVWGETEEGHEYWRDITKKLEAMLPKEEP